MMTLRNLEKSINQYTPSIYLGKNVKRQGELSVSRKVSRCFEQFF